MSLPWIKVYRDLPGHPKSRALAKLTGNDRAWTHVVELWLWCAINEPGGDLSQTTDTMIGTAAGVVPSHVPGDARVDFARALRVVGFLDSDGSLHDWQDEQAAHVNQRETDRQKKAAKRAKKKAEKDAASKPSEGMSPGTATQTSPINASPREDQRSEIEEEREEKDPPVIVAAPKIEHAPPLAQASLSTATPQLNPYQRMRADRERVFDHYVAKISPIAKTSVKRQGRLEIILKGNLGAVYTADELCECIDGYASQDWWMGRGSSTEFKATFENIFDKEGGIDKGREFYRSTVKSKTRIAEPLPPTKIASTEEIQRTRKVIESLHKPWEKDGSNG